MRLAVALILCIFAVVMFSMQFAAAQQNDYVVVPGQRLGPWELGKPVDTYDFGPHSSKWEGTASGRPYYDGYTFPQQPRGPYLYAYACKSDNLLFALMVARRLNLQLSSDAEEFKYRTTEDVRIGTDEGDVVRLLGNPDATSQFADRHGQFELVVRHLEYRSKGLLVRVNQTENKVFALGAARAGGFPACQQAAQRAAQSTQTRPTSSAARPTQVGLTTPRALKTLAESVGIPIPYDIRIIRPASDVPAAIVYLSGIWDGTVSSQSGGVEPQIVVFEQITSSPATVRVFYAWAGRFITPGWTRLRGTFVGNTVIVEERYVSQQDGPVHKTRRFQLVDNSTLRHSWETTVRNRTYKAETLLSRF